MLPLRLMFAVSPATPRWREFWPTWENWFLGDALANLVFTPLLLGAATNWKALTKGLPVRRMEAAAIFGLLILAVRWSHQLRPGDSNPIDAHGYLPIAFLLLAAVRFGPMGASAALATMTALSIADMDAAGPGSGLSVAFASVLSLQLFLIVIGIPIMSLSVLIEQQRKTERSLRESESSCRTQLRTATEHGGDYGFERASDHCRGQRTAPARRGIA